MSLPKSLIILLVEPFLSLSFVILLILSSLLPCLFLFRHISKNVIHALLQLRVQHNLCPLSTVPSSGSWVLQLYLGLPCGQTLGGGHIGNLTSSAMTLRSPPPCPGHPHDCVTACSSDFILVKFADDTTMATMRVPTEMSSVSWQHGARTATGHHRSHQWGQETCASGYSVCSSTMTSSRQ